MDISRMPDLGEDRRVLRVSETLKTRPIVTVLLTLALLLPAVAAFGILYRRAPFVPFMDDYHAILVFAADYQGLHGVKAKVLQVATKQHNEYKLIFEHFIVASEIELTGRLNFTFLTNLGNLFLLPIGYLLWRTYQQGESDLNSRLLRFLPISLLFFSLVYCEALDFAMSGLQNIAIVFFSFLSIYLLTHGHITRPGWIWLLASLCAAALATCSSANGLLLIPVGLLVLFARRAYAEAIAWCAGSALLVAVYFYRYTPVVHPAGKDPYITRPLVFLAFLGCAVPLRWPAALLGIVVLIILSRAVFARFDRINPASFYFAVWIVGTAGVVAWGRGAKNFGVASRYSIYSSLLLIFCYNFLATRLSSVLSSQNRRRFYVACSVLALCFCLAADLFANKHLRARQRMIISGIESYRANPEVNSPMIDPRVEVEVPSEKASEREILTMVIQKHIYALPPKQESLWKGEF
jgi:hypothetical protein